MLKNIGELITWREAERAKGNQQVYRVIHVGSSGSGKTTVATQLINAELERGRIPGGTNNTTFVFAFYKPSGDDLAFQPYRSYPNPTPSDIKVATELVKQIRDLARPEVRSLLRFIFLFDDVIDEKLSKSNELNDLFGTCRHLDISLIYIMQTFTIYLTQFMKNNATHYALFKMSNARQISSIVDEIIKPQFFILGPDIHKADKEARNRAMSAYISTISKKYGYLLIMI